MKKTAVLCGIILGAYLAGSTVQAETVSSSMNFRAEPSATGSLIGSVPKGAEVTVLNSQNGWDYISYNGIGGWIHGGNVTSQPVAQTAAPAAGTTTSSAAGVSGQSARVLYGMNFRANPGMSGQIMNVIPAGTTVQYLGSSNGWDKVVYNGVTGWIASGRTTTTTTAAATVGAAALASTSASASASGTSGQSVKVLYGMNFRANPGMSGRIMGGVPAGTTVQYLGSSNGWDKIVYNGVTGWIASGRTTTAAAAGTAAQTGTLSSVAGTAKTVTTAMNFRAAGNLAGSKIGLIPAGAKVTYVTSADGWEQVIYNGQSGWIKGGNTR